MLSFILSFSSSSHTPLTHRSDGEKEEEEKVKEGEMRPTCARLQVSSTGTVQLFDEVCSAVTRGAAGGRVCTCQGEGLFGLLLMSSTPTRITQVGQGLAGRERKGVKRCGDGGALKGTKRGTVDLDRKDIVEERQRSDGK